MDINPYLDALDEIAKEGLKITKQQTVITIAEYGKNEFDNKLQGYIDILLKSNREYTIQFSVTFDSYRLKPIFSAMIIFEGDCCL